MAYEYSQLSNPSFFRRMLLNPNFCILLWFLCCLQLSKATLNLTLPHQHPYPEEVVQELRRKVHTSISRRKLLSVTEKQQAPCLTGNPIDDCWRCDPNWEANRQHLADCGIGFGSNAGGGKGGQIYVVNDSSDDDVSNPKAGTLRHAVTQPVPLWIIFSANMLIKLNHELRVTSFKTIDGRGAAVEITGGGCLTLDRVTNVIIHNIMIHHCKPANSDGDGISIIASSKIWVDHCSLSKCRDGLIDVTEGSTGVTISNSMFRDHNKVMLLGNSDDFEADSGMQVTIAFNHFGENLVQRMPRCRRGYFHVVNNDYTMWEMYAIGGSANPTINCQGNRYTAPANPSAKEVTKREDAKEKEWVNWDWRSEGDIMVNGAFFVASGAGLGPQFVYDMGADPRSPGLIDQLTMHAGLLGQPGGGYGGSGSIPDPGFNYGGGGRDGSSGDNGDYFGMIFGAAAPQSSSTITWVMLVVLILNIIINHVEPLLLQHFSFW